MKNHEIEIKEKLIGENDVHKVLVREQEELQRKKRSKFSNEDVVSEFMEMVMSGKTNV